MEPPAMKAGGSGRSCMIDRAVRLLPEPDSPTTARISPRSRSRSSSETASNGPRAVASRMVRPRTVRRSPIPLPQDGIAGEQRQRILPEDQAPVLVREEIEVVEGIGQGLATGAEALH